MLAILLGNIRNVSFFEFGSKLQIFFNRMSELKQDLLAIPSSPSPSYGTCVSLFIAKEGHTVQARIKSDF